jgi:hypothetical protein
MKTYYLLLLALFMLSCSSQQNQNEGNLPSSQVLKIAGGTADFLQMTPDANGDIVAWWVEEDPETQQKTVHFSKASTGLTFSQNIRIAASKGVNPGGGESMPKLVIKPNGTYVLIFSKRHEDSKAMFAGSVYYTQSFDESQTWSEPKAIPGDKNEDNSHAFPQAILLPDGEVAAAWLDGRHHLNHSSMYFAKTNGDEGFGKDKIIGGPSCQCCKIGMYVDAEDILHIAYRGIEGDNIRDIHHFSSADNGASFSDVSIVSNDQWHINACPHNGPSLTQMDNKLRILWFTGQGEAGVYMASSPDEGTHFSPRQKLSNYAKHLYLASAGNTTLALWEEPFTTDDHHYTRVKLSMLSADSQVRSDYLSPENVKAAMPYLLERDNGTIVAMWTQYGEQGTQLHYRLFTNAELVAQEKS